MRSLLRPALAAACALSLVPAAAAAAATPEWFPLPDNRNVGTGIVADPDGTVWFAGDKLGAETTPPLGRLLPAQASAGTPSGITFFPTPAVSGEGCCANFIRGLAYDAANGRVWFVRSTGVYGFGRPAEMVAGTSQGTVADILSTPLDLGGIALQSTGLAWITESGTSNVTPDWPGSRVASVTADLGLNELPNLGIQTGVQDSSRYDAKPAGITVDKDGAVWFVESSPGLPGYRVGKVVGGGYQEYLITPCAPSGPCSGSHTGTGPVDIAAAPDGTIWFTNVIKNTVGRLDPGAGTITQFALAGIDAGLAGGQPRSIRLAPDGTLWLAQFGFISNPGANAIVRIVPSATPTATVYKLGAGKAPLSVAPDTKGNVWFTATGDTQPDFVGRLAGVVDAPAPALPGPGGQSPAPDPAPGGVTLKPATIATAKIGDPRVDGRTVKVNQICVGPPADRCSLVYLLDTREYVTGFPGTRASAAAKKRKTRRVVIGRKTVTINGGQQTTVKIKLNAKGKRILKRDGKLNATLRVKRKLAGGKTTKLKTKKLVFKSGR